MKEELEEGHQKVRFLSLVSRVLQVEGLHARLIEDEDPVSNLPPRVLLPRRLSAAEHHYKGHAHGIKLGQSDSQIREQREDPDGTHIFLSGQGCKGDISVEIKHRDLCHQHLEEGLEESFDHKLASTCPHDTSVLEGSEVVFEAFSFDVLASEDAIKDKGEEAEKTHGYMTHPLEAGNATCDRDYREDDQKKPKDEVLHKVIEHEAATGEEEVLVPDLLCNSLSLLG